jgi:hypothetical protein
MTEIIRRSPVVFDSRPVKAELRSHWTVVVEYEQEGSGPYLVDLSHRTRWDLQHAELSEVRPWGSRVPDFPGHCAYESGILINRMNRTQASLWHLAGEMPVVFDGPAITDVTDATVFLALLGNNIFSITEKLTSLDFLDPSRKTPFLLQGPFSHVPCQIVTLEKNSNRSAILLTCSRGYAHDMVAAILSAGREFELRPAGEQIFVDWMNGFSAF